MKVNQIVEQGSPGKSELKKITDEINRLRKKYDDFSNAWDLARRQGRKKDMWKLRREEKKARREWLAARRKLEGVRLSKPKGLKITGQEDWQDIKTTAEKELKRFSIAFLNWYSVVHRQAERSQSSTSTRPTYSYIEDSHHRWGQVTQAVEHALKHLMPDLSQEQQRAMRRRITALRNYIDFGPAFEKKFNEFFKPHMMMMTKRIIDAYKRMTFATGKLLDKPVTPTSEIPSEEQQGPEDLP